MHQIARAIARFVIAARLPLILLCLALTAYFAWSLKDLTIQSRLGDFIPADHPYVKVQDKLTEVFGGLNQVTIAIRVKEGDILNPETLGKVHRITRELYLMDGINAGRVLSLSSRRIKFTRPTADGFESKALMKTPPQTPGEIAALKEKITRTPLVFGSPRSRFGPIVSRDFKNTLIQADFESSVASREIFRRLQEIVEREEDPNHEIYLTGRPILEGWLDYYLPTMARIFALTIIIMVVLLYLIFRSKRGVVLPLLSAAMATVWGLGAMTRLGYRLHPGTALVPFLVLALAISHSVQFIKRYYERSARPRMKSPRAARDTLQSLFLPACASLVTDALGFLSLVVVPLAWIKSLSIAAGAGVVSIFFTTVIFIPAVLSYLPEPKRREVEEEEKFTLINRALAAIARVVTAPRGRRAVLAVFLLLALGALLGAFRLVVGDNEPGSALLSRDSPYNRAESFVNATFTGSTPYYVFVDGTEGDAVMDSAVLKEMESLQDYLLQAIPEAGAASSLADYVKGLNFVMFDFIPREFRIPDNNKTIAEYMFLYTSSGFPADFKPVVDENCRRANIKVDVKDHRAATIKKIMTATGDWMRDRHRTPLADFLFPGGEIGVMAAVNEIIASALPMNILQISVLVMVCVMAAFGSIAAGGLLIVPLAFSVLLTFGAMGLFGVSLTVETLPVAALGIGLGVDYGIYVLASLRGEFVLRRHLLLEDALYRSLASSGKAVFFTGITVAAGVFAWVLSPIRFQARLGLVLGSLLFLNVLAALILLPCLIALFKPRFIFRQKRW
ncbi:MAG: MMPL family transporter [Candidatus Aureabacteria bacterium]|nr:MMPL family transporter [Candidatus Auribacterota bacterium]